MGKPAETELVGKMQTVNGQLKDNYVGSVWQNPEQEFNNIAISPSTNYSVLQILKITTDSESNHLTIS